jgi:predicted extracellular nuclease
MKSFYLLLLFLVHTSLFAQQDTSALFPGFDDRPRGMDGIRVVSYNVENLFDFTHDSLKRDQEFLPEGARHWNSYKYWKKQNKIAKVITATGGWEPPAIVGLFEVENRHVLINLVYNTSLKPHGYRIVHHESPDRRGIDVAMIYRPEKVQIIEEKAISVRFPFDTASKTRDILYVKARVLYADTVIFFFNHWPSRWGGQFVTEPKRMYAAKKLKKITDSIQKLNPCAKIVIMGDFNDHPSDKSLTEGLRARTPKAYTKHGLINLMIPMEEAGLGTHFYNSETGGQWNLLDHIIVSRALMWDCSGAYVRDQQAHIFRPPFLFQANKSGVLIPNRTFIGFRYNGGFSDHLPVYVDLFLKKD